tara:strand:+ start:456 stop:752 length:297 start_codon:yes stop_codon:yes gene_type:complete
LVEDNREVISCNNRGLLIPNKNTGKSKKFVPWKHVNKVKVDKGVYKFSVDNVDCWHVRKEVNKQKLDRIYMSEREALRAVDMLLIKNGREPQYILKKK